MEINEYLNLGWVLFMGQKKEAVKKRLGHGIVNEQQQRDTTLYFIPTVNLY